MRILQRIQELLLATLATYWTLVKITVPITVASEVLMRTGVIDRIAPLFEPVMQFVGLPSALGLAWVTALIVGLWGAIPLIFTLVPVETLSVADITVFSALILFAHGLPLEQKIIQNAGPGFWITTAIRVIGGLTYALILHRSCAATGWLTAPVNPAWIPLQPTSSWITFFLALAETMAWMLVILLVLALSLDALRRTGILGKLIRVLSPLLQLAGIRGEAVYLTTVGLLLGISYGAGLLIREAQSGRIPPRQIFLSCVFMGFSHSLIEDTLLVMALGADITGVLIGRVIFTFALSALIAVALAATGDRAFFALAYSAKPTKDAI